MVINHLLTGMILQVQTACVFFGGVPFLETYQEMETHRAEIVAQQAGWDWL